jgi:glycosyltransferase involved in cell wall biosynthesis
MLVLPSIEENCPMVILEAMAAGVPVVASKVGGVPDLIEEGITGLLMQPGNPSSIASAIERLLANPGAAGEMAGRARARALAAFEPRVVAERHHQIYRDVLNAAR